MLFRLLAFAVCGTVATAQVPIDWTNTIPAGQQVAYRAVCFDVPGRTIYSAAEYVQPSTWQGVLRAVDSQGSDVWTVPTLVGATTIAITSIAYDGAGHIAAAGVRCNARGVSEGGGLIVYDLQGNVVWSRTWSESAGALWADARIVGFRNGGPVLVGVYPDQPLGQLDLAAVAFDAGGTVLWHHAWSTPLSEITFDAILAANGDVIVAGNTFEPQAWVGGSFVRRFSPSGSVTWSIGRTGDDHSAVAVDSQDRVYVAGSRNYRHEALILRLDPNTGQELFAHTIISDGESGLGDVAIAPDGIVVATGRRFTLAAGLHALTVAVDPVGTELWRAGYQATDSNLRASAHEIDVDEFGNVAVAGMESNASEWRALVISYPRAIAPIRAWVSEEHPGVPGTTDSFTIGVKLDPSGAVRVAGNTLGSAGDPSCVWQLDPEVRTVCVGDGSDGPCPCGNTSTPFARAGCINSLNVGGKLEWIGAPSLSADTLTLWVSDVPPSSTMLFAQGSGAAAPSAPFGDGIACLGTPIVRLGTETASLAGRVDHPGDLSSTTISAEGSVVGPGAVHTYQVRYRNAASFCTSATWNSTNAIVVTWRP